MQHPSHRIGDSHACDIRSLWNPSQYPKMAENFVEVGNLHVYIAKLRLKVRALANECLASAVKVSPYIVVFGIEHILEGNYVYSKKSTRN